VKTAVEAEKKIMRIGGKKRLQTLSFSMNISPTVLGGFLLRVLVTPFDRTKIF
jgi:hypothetical protein